MAKKITKKILKLSEVCELRDRIRFEGYVPTRLEALWLSETALDWADNDLGMAEIHEMVEDLCRELLSKKKP